MLNMTPTEHAQGDASQQARALARWENEGGALNSYSSKGGAKRAKTPAWDGPERVKAFVDRPAMKRGLIR